MRQQRANLLAVLALVTVSALSACGSGEDRRGVVTEEGGSGTGAGSASGSATHSGSVSATAARGFPEAEASSVIEVEMADHRFSGIPEKVKGPKIFFKVRNRGPSEHELEVIGPDQRRLGEVRALKPGRSGVLAAELAPGAYTVQCLVEADDKTHAQLGMEATFMVA